MNASLGYREVFALTLEQLKEHPDGQWETLTAKTIEAAKRKGLIPSSRPSVGTFVGGKPLAEYKIGEHVQQAMWDCLLKRLIVFGMNNANPTWPFYRVTEHGVSALKSATPQPYDPDGFIAHFDAKCAGIEPVVRSYVVEAVQAFNSDCTRSAAVMLGCASEKLLLLLCEAFEAAISDPTKQAKFIKDANAKWPISHKYTTLRDRLDLMVATKKLPREHAETVASELPAGFELLRRCRNAAGHPDVLGDVDSDIVFMNLRMFTEYARRVHALIEYFGKTSADW